MRLFVIKPIKLKKSGRLFDVSPVAIVEIATPEKAKTLILSGHVRPLLPPDEAGQPYAAKIYSHILQDVVWLALDPTFTGNGDGIPVYSIEELSMMQGADAYTMRLIHTCKKELGGLLVSATEIKES